MVKYNMKAVRGDTFAGVEFNLTKNDEPVILTDAVIKADFKLGAKVGTPAMSLITGAGITITDAAAGIFQIDPIEELQLKAGNYFYDIQVTIGTEVKTYIGGEMEVEQDVTN